MDDAIFLLAKDPENDCRDIIFHRDGTLRIKVFCLDGMNYHPNPEELQFYADNHGETLGFETQGYNYEDPGLVIEAIRWYAKYLGNPEMEIDAEMHSYDRSKASHHKH